MVAEGGRNDVNQLHVTLDISAANGRRSAECIGVAVFEEAEYRLDQSQICRIRQLGNLIIPPSCNATLLIINHSTNSRDGSTTGICIAASSVTKARLSLKAGARTDGRTGGGGRMDILRNADCRRADKNYLIFLPSLTCGNNDEGRRRRWCAGGGGRRRGTGRPSSDRR